MALTSNTGAYLHHTVWVIIQVHYRTWDMNEHLSAVTSRFIRFTSPCCSFHDNAVAASSKNHTGFAWLKTNKVHITAGTNTWAKKLQQHVPILHLYQVSIRFVDQGTNWMVAKWKEAFPTLISASWSWYDALTYFKTFEAWCRLIQCTKARCWLKRFGSYWSFNRAASAFHLYCRLKSDQAVMTFVSPWWRTVICDRCLRPALF